MPGCYRYVCMSFLGSGPCRKVLICFLQFPSMAMLVLYWAQHCATNTVPNNRKSMVQRRYPRFLLQMPQSPTTIQDSHLLGYTHPCRSSSTGKTPFTEQACRVACQSTMLIQMPETVCILTVDEPLPGFSPDRKLEPANWMTSSHTRLIPANPIPDGFC